ncbi:HD domain-containing protein [Flexivirga oryzae]|uniref:Putative metal-dependent HD superfamily phosphohydrolase n=1 Tax=Flexivirga oryzae TaxID=1794944 RepID=A0A839N3D2_9MICO|nr:metal-dependent phosphohydrolase [Flexivirga oryzae]MBB2890463.1 putative metal-dependent HD superfamily phosphohydrolase [Flexivirga oryzae]
MAHNDLLDSWVSNLIGLTPAVEPASTLRAGETLLARWTEPHRHYHTLQHLTEMLAALDTLSAAACLDPRELHLARVAAWLHDAVYEVHAPAGDSERASAQLARNLLVSLRVGRSDVDVVEALILLTIDHGTGLPGALADVFTDADLWILAASPDRFDAYCSQVRAEYASVPEASYNQARSAILASLVDRHEVYRTSFGRAEWTVTARENVAREIDRLGHPHGIR